MHGQLRKVPGEMAVSGNPGGSRLRRCVMKLPGVTSSFLVSLTVSTCLAIACSQAFYPPSVHAATRSPSYTVTLLAQHFGSDGNVWMSEALIVAVREDGSRAVVSARTFKENGKLRTSRRRWFYDLKRRLRVSVYDFKRTKITTALGQRAYQMLTAPMSEDCLKPFERKLGAGVRPAKPILGYQTVLVSRRIRTRDGTGVLLESWRAPELACEVLRERKTLLDASGKPVYLNELKEAVSVASGAPAEFFTIPEGYVERSPSEMLELYYREAGREMHPSLRRVLPRADQRYHKGRQHLRGN